MTRTKRVRWWNVPTAPTDLSLVGPWYRSTLLVVLGVALLQGLIYLWLLPPWQHYDEPTHFEYAWLIANKHIIPEAEDIDYPMRRAVLASMIEHGFYRGTPAPDLDTITDVSQFSIGSLEFGHPPTYYLLVSIPLLLVSNLSIEAQLYVARSVSLILFLVTVWITSGIVRDLTPPGHMLRWLVPLTLILLPPMPDLMTAVNNDAGAITLVSLFLWGAVRTIRFGLSWPRLAWLIGSALLGVATKNTAAVTLVLIPVVVILAIWVRQGWRWRWLVLGTLTPVVAVLLLTFTWQGAAYWYQGVGPTTQSWDARSVDAQARDSTHVLRIEVPPSDLRRSLFNPVLPEDVQRVAGQTVTFGGWIWADEPLTLRGLGLRVGNTSQDEAITTVEEVPVTTTPTFVALTTEIPAETTLIHYVFAGRPLQPIDQSVRISLDQAFLIAGTFPAGEQPVFDDTSGRTGTWAGQSFVNLVRNGSAEAAWPVLRPSIDQAIVHYAHRSFANVIASVLDFPRTGNLLLIMPSFILWGFFTRLAWGHIALDGMAWQYAFRGVGLLALIGCILWLVRSRPTASVRAAIGFLALTGGSIWLAAMLAPFPWLGTRIFMPASRYAFPAMIPTVLLLVGGWWALWPRAYRRVGVLIFVAALVLLNLSTLWTVWSFYATTAVTQATQ